MRACQNPLLVAAGGGGTSEEFEIMVSPDALFGKPLDRYVPVTARRAIVQGLFAHDKKRVLDTVAPRVSRPGGAKRRWAGRSVTIQEEMR